MFAGLTAEDVKSEPILHPLSFLWRRLDTVSMARGDGIVSGASLIAHLKLGSEKGLLTLLDGIISCAGSLMMRRNDNSKCIGVVIRSQVIG